MEDEQNGRRRLRALGKSFDLAKFAPNAFSEIFSVYLSAIGSKRAQCFVCVNQAGKTVHREKYVQPTQEEAARDLLAITKWATVSLAGLLDREPKLCRRIEPMKRNGR